MKGKTPMKWILKMSKPQNLKMIILILSNAVFSVLSVVFAFAIKEIIDSAVDGNSKRLLTFSLVIGGVVVLQFVFRVIINGLTEHIRGKLEMAYKTHLFNQILSKKQDKITAYHSGELLNRLTSDVSVVSEGVSTILPTVVAAVTRLASAVVALILLDWIFAVAFTVAGILVFLVISLLRGKLKSLHKRTQETDGKVRSFMQECIENLLAVKVFSANGKVERKSTALQEDNFKVKMKRKNYSVMGHATYNMIFSAGYLFALIYGAVKLLNGMDGFTYGALSAILQLVNNVQVPFASLSNILPKYYAMTASAERLMEIEQIEDEPKLSVEKSRDDLYKDMQSIVFDDVCFTYDRDRVLKDASAVINKGDFVMVTGKSGAGKSTLIKLMLGVYPCESGEIYLKTDTINQPLDSSTRSLFSYVPQGNMLFSGTLRDNVTFINSDATEEQIAHALRISQAEQFVLELPQGLDTVVGESGVGLSEGQIQRIAIARAILSDAPIILLDEATSALDDQTEQKVLLGLKEMQDKTLIIISHRKSVASICNREIMLKDRKLSDK
ncbi:MAG: ABC transporter ATP-binding protein [Clostridia bacterium]|nr:ABC transporter ATP-binding protein [Clostridia bacterium]